MKKIDAKRKQILITCNIILIILALAGSIIYSNFVYRTQQEARKDDFIRTIESMKQVSQNHLDSEKGYINDWAYYMSERNMTLSEALDFLRSINTDKDRFAHIIDMDTYEAYSSYYDEGLEAIDTYVKYKDKDVESEEPFGDIMEDMFDGTDDDFCVLGKYRLDETQAMGVGVGTRVTINVEDGTKDYLLMRIIPVDELKKSWVFPTEYSTAEIGIITRSGDYVIQSPSMKSLNFTEYIRGYNFENEYNEMDNLKKQLENTESGLLEYKNFRNVDCWWYYSSFGSGSALDILGVIGVNDLKGSFDAWYIILLVCGTLIILAFIDGIYLIGINHRLMEEAKIAERASKAKTQFLSAMSHDIRTPLNAVMGTMELAKKKSEDSVYVTDCMDKGLHSGKQLLTLINDVLDISRIESGNLILTPENVVLPDMMHDLTELLRQSINKKGIMLDCDYSRLPFECVYVDKMRLNQIYMNLMSNAVKYTNDGGKIKVQLYEEEIDGNKDDIRLIFCIDDTGIGMTEEFQKNMYNTFAREINTKVNTIQGTGLGLSIVKQIVDLMGGDIKCESAPGVGTSFVVTLELPVVKDYKENVPEDDITENIEGMHLLVAEDNELNWEIFNEMMSGNGIICDHAWNGQECIDMLKNVKEGTYSVILMDVNMPVMNGLEATKIIRSMQDENINKIPIIALTADAFAEDVKECMNSGMNGHIAKPVSMKVLMEYLAKIKNGQL